MSLMLARDIPLRLFGKVMNYGLKKEFFDRYNVDAVLKENHLTAEQIVEDVLSIS